MQTTEKHFFLKLCGISAVIYKAATAGGIFNIKPLNTIWPQLTWQLKTKVRLTVSYNIFSLTCIVFMCVFCDLYWVFPYCLFVSNSQVIGCEDRLRNGLVYTVLGEALNSYSVQSNPFHCCLACWCFDAFLVLIVIVFFFFFCVVSVSEILMNKDVYYMHARQPPEPPECGATWLYTVPAGGPKSDTPVLNLR